MNVVVAGVVLVGVLVMLDLVLSFGLIRRLREHAARMEQLETTSGLRRASADIIVGVGSRPAPFSATTIEGEEVSDDWFAGPALVGFFAPGCGPCKEWLPRFVAAAESLSRDSVRVLAVLSTGDVDSAEEVATLREAAHVVVEEGTGPVHQAFSVHGWPAMCRLGDDGTVATTTNSEVVAVPVGS